VQLERLFVNVFMTAPLPERKAAVPVLQLYRRTDLGQVCIQNRTVREFVRRGVSQHTLEKICSRKPVRVAKLAKCLKLIEELKKGAA
jgi:hypothetical protein